MSKNQTWVAHRCYKVTFFFVIYFSIKYFVLHFILVLTQSLLSWTHSTVLHVFDTVYLQFSHIMEKKRVLLDHFWWNITLRAEDVISWCSGETLQTSWNIKTWTNMFEFEHFTCCSEEMEQDSDLLLYCVVNEVSQTGGPALRLTFDPRQVSENTHAPSIWLQLK